MKAILDLNAPIVTSCKYTVKTKSLLFFFGFIAQSARRLKQGSLFDYFGSDSPKINAGGTVTPVKQDPSITNSGGSLAGASPSGVNRRTAVLFTRKAASVHRKPDTSDNPSL